MNDTRLPDPAAARPKHIAPDEWAARVQLAAAYRIFDHLAAGEIVLGGSFTRPVACTAGDEFLADYGRLGAIHVRFV